MNKETRAFSFEVRADEDQEHGHFITGRPIVFGQETDLGFCSERIDPGALDKTDLKDVRFLIGHNTGMIPLARSRNNNENSTMQLIPGDEGMDIRVDLDTENNAEARALYSAVKRGDMSGMSFMFTVDKDSWDDVDTDSESPVRWLEQPEGHQRLAGLGCKAGLPPAEPLLPRAGFSPDSSTYSV